MNKDLQIAKKTVETEIAALKKLSLSFKNSSNFTTAVNLISKTRGKVLVVGVGGWLGKWILKNAAEKPLVTGGKNLFKWLIQLLMLQNLHKLTQFTLLFFEKRERNI